jgi:hypothetical protein
VIFIWMESKEDKLLNGAGPRPKFIRSRRENIPQVGVQDLSQCSAIVFGPLGRVSCLGPLGLRPEGLDRPKLPLSSRHPLL